MNRQEVGVWGDTRSFFRKRLHLSNKETQNGSFKDKNSRGHCPAVSDEHQIRTRFNKTMSVRRRASTKRRELIQHSRKQEPGITFQDVNTLLVGWVGVRVVRRHEHPAIDVADPHAAVVLAGDLAAGVAWRI